MTDEERREEMRRNEELIDDNIYEQLETLIEDTRNICESQQSGSQEREKEIKNLKLLIDAREEMRQTDTDRIDKEERRRIEEIKNLSNKEIEMIKAKKGMKEYLLEYGQIAFKGAISLLGSLVILGTILEFEEKGTLHSKPGRDFRFVNPFNLKF